MGQERKNLPLNLYRSFNNDYTKTILIDMSESLLENATKSIFDSGTLQKLPIVGGMVAVGTGILDLRERLFVSKVLRVLAEISDVSEEKKKTFKDKLDNDPNMANKSGAILLDLIDKTTGAEKSAMIGKVIRATMEKNLDHDTMISLCEMIVKSYLSDLQALARPEGQLGPVPNDVNLEGVGIKKSMRAEDVNKALEALSARIKAEIPIVRDKIINTEADPTIIESGYTELGSILVKILKQY
jgi:hypothetical protein